MIAIPDFRFLTGTEAETAMWFVLEAAEIAREALCERSKCGAVVVKEHGVIGKGKNDPPLRNSMFRTCNATYDTPAGFPYDRTCCIHAEQDAIEDAKRRYPTLVVGARLYFAGLDKDGKLKPSRKPKCTVCSRWALRSGVAEFALFHEEGICVYSTPYYDRISFQFVSQ